MMADDNTEIFIDAVNNFPCLYNPQHSGYKDVEIKRNAWLEVTKVSAMKDDAASKLKWKRLRDYYRDCLRKLKTTTGQARKKIKRWSYLEQMEFLRPTLIHPNTHSNILSEEEGDGDIDIEVEDDETETPRLTETPPPNETPRFVPRNAIKRKNSENCTENVIMKSFAQKMAQNKPQSQDPIDSFFKGISDTVKKLPLLSQNAIKLQVSNIVFTEEQRVLQGQQRQQQYPIHHEPLTNENMYSFGPHSTLTYQSSPQNNN